MCLNYTYAANEQAKMEAKLPDIIPVWRFITPEGKSWFSKRTAPVLTDRRVHEADYNVNSPVPDRTCPGFHSYFTKTAAEIGLWHVAGARFHCGQGIVKKFWIRKKWINKIGHCPLSGSTAVTSFKITTRKPR